MTCRPASSGQGIGWGPSGFLLAEPMLGRQGEQYDLIAGQCADVGLAL